MNSDQGVDEHSLNQVAYVMGNPLMVADYNGMDPHEYKGEHYVEGVSKRGSQRYDGDRMEVLNKWVQDADEAGLFKKLGGPLGGPDKLENLIDVLGDTDYSKLTFNDISKKYASTLFRHIRSQKIHICWNQIGYQRTD